MSGIKIKGTGSHVPDRIVTNEDLSHMVETSDEWIFSRTGIHTRHLCQPEETHLGLCLEAAKAALADAGVAPEEIGGCIVATVTSDTMVPAAACLLQRDLGLPCDIPCFDLNAACTGFLFALHTMECLLAASGRRYGLVVGGEMLSRITDWSDRGTCILFGDGAGAAVVEFSREWDSIGAVLGCRGNEDLLRVPGVGSSESQHIFMDGKAVFRFAVEMVPKCMDQVLQEKNCSIEDVDFFVFHQANARIIDHVVKKYHIPEDKYYKDIEEYGNTSAASIPLVLDDLKKSGRIKSKSRLLVVGFGGGMTWGGALIEVV